MTQAWIVDEIGEKRAGEAFLRGSQAGQAGGLIAIPIRIALGNVSIRAALVASAAILSPVLPLYWIAIWRER